MERVERNGLAFSSQAFPQFSSDRRLASSPFNIVILAGLMQCIISPYKPCLAQAFVATTTKSGLFPLHHQPELLHPIFRECLGSQGLWVKPVPWEVMEN